MLKIDNFHKLHLECNNIKGRFAPSYIVVSYIQCIKNHILPLVHIFSILDFENYYKNRFLFLFSILIKLFDHEIVNCEIIHDVSMLIYILTTENEIKLQKFQQTSKFTEFFFKVATKSFSKIFIF